MQGIGVDAENRGEVLRERRSFPWFGLSLGDGPSEIGGNLLEAGTSPARLTRFIVLINLAPLTSESDPCDPS